MEIKISVEKGKIPKRAQDFFDFSKLDAFHTSEVLSVIYGEEWYAVLIFSEKEAMFHTFSKQSIPGTEYYDIEPFLGYAGPVSNSTDKLFLKQALDIYSEFCKNEKIIAEIVRFNPLLNNQILFKQNDLLKVFLAKEIIITKTHKEEDLQLSEFSTNRKRNIKAAKKSCYLNLQETNKDIDDFLKIYIDSLDRVNANKAWYFSDDFFQRVCLSSKFKLFEARNSENVFSTCILINHPLASYYLLAANSIPPMNGANDYLIYEINRWSAHKAIDHVILGGGNTTSEDDALLLYKKRFVKKTTAFYMGKIIHVPHIFDILCKEAISKKPELTETNFFLKYRL
jgi:hypothetical protein